MAPTPGTSIPLLAWIVSAFALHYFGLVMPNGLQGVYKLTPYNSVDIELRKAQISPTAILDKLRRNHQIDEVYWLKLQSRGRYLWYIVKPTPSTWAWSSTPVPANDWTLCPTNFLSWSRMNPCKARTPYACHPSSNITVIIP